MHHTITIDGVDLVLTTDHSASSYGRPVLVVGDCVYGPNETPLYDRALVAIAIAISGLSARQWASDIAWRNERTVRRWLSGDSPIGSAIRIRLLEIIGSAVA